MIEQNNSIMENYRRPAYLLLVQTIRLSDAPTKLNVLDTALAPVYYDKTVVQACADHAFRDQLAKNSIDVQLLSSATHDQSARNGLRAFAEKHPSLNIRNEVVGRNDFAFADALTRTANHFLPKP